LSSVAPTKALAVARTRSSSLRRVSGACPDTRTHT
jgi:hypothetical protein